ncbi:hypothetical protein PL81_23605, partial [Streptomyces sp. RSD-27]
PAAPAYDGYAPAAYAAPYPHQQPHQPLPDAYAYQDPYAGYGPQQDPYGGYAQQPDPYAAYQQPPQQPHPPQQSHQPHPPQQPALDETSFFDTSMINLDQLRGYEQGR